MYMQVFTRKCTYSFKANLLMYIWKSKLYMQVLHEMLKQKLCVKSILQIRYFSTDKQKRLKLLELLTAEDVLHMGKQTSKPPYIYGQWIFLSQNLHDYFTKFCIYFLMLIRQASSPVLYSRASLIQQSDTFIGILHCRRTCPTLLLVQKNVAWRKRDGMEPYL